MTLPVKMPVVNLCLKLNPMSYCTGLVLVGVRFLQFFGFLLLSGIATGAIGAGGVGGGASAATGVALGFLIRLRPWTVW